VRTGNKASLLKKRQTKDFEDQLKSKFELKEEVKLLESKTPDTGSADTKLRFIPTTVGS